MDGIVQWLPGRRLLPIRLLLSAFCVLLFTSQLALAQLRTGRAERPLYKAHLSDAPAELPSQLTEADSIVSPASYTSGEQFVDESFGHEVATGAMVYAEPGAAMVSPTCDCAECSGEGMVYFDSPSCDGFGCAAGCASCKPCSRFDGSWLATPATGVCAPSNVSPFAAFFHRTSFRFEVPLYWRRGQGPPPLVTTAPVGTAGDLAGRLDQDATQVLFGNFAVGNDIKTGFRYTMNTWLGQKDCYAIMLRAWSAGELEEQFNFSSNDAPILARPFLNTTIAGAPEADTQLVAFPDQQIGSIQIDTRSMVNGLELSLRRQLYRDRFTRLDWLWGYQHVNIEESLSIFNTTTVIGDANPELQGTQIDVFDSFETQNEFNGMHYGLLHSRNIACWKWETLFRLGAGNLRRQVQTRGSSTTRSQGTVATVNEGLLARSTNSQPFRDDTFVVIPELGVNLACRLRPGVHFNVGYNYLVVPKVAQAAQQIDPDLAVNLSDPLVGSLDPALEFVERRYWLHSLGLGLQFRY